MRADELARQGKEYQEKYSEASDESFVMVKEKIERKTINRIIEEGVYNIKDSDYEAEGGDSKLRAP